MHSRPLTLETFEFTSRAGRSLPAQRGVLAVPMRHGVPGDHLLELAMVRFSARSAAGEPVVFLAGGPGISAIRWGRGRLFDLFQVLAGERDVVLLEQRGCGESKPVLVCNEPLGLADDRAHTREEFLSAALQATRRCAADFERQGIELAAFNVDESADDVAVVARALYGDSARVALLGHSYGTHLAMAVMRRHPELITRAVLAGPEGPDQTWKLPSTIESFLSELERNYRVPELRANLRRAFERLAAEPVRANVRGEDGVARTILIGRFEMEWMVAENLADTRFLRRLPLWAARWAQGDFAMMDDPVLVSSCEHLRHGLVESLVRICGDCASSASRERMQQILEETPKTTLGRTIDFLFPEICAAIGEPRLADDARTPPRSDAPILFITGTLDCRTPAANIADYGGGLSNQRHIVIRGAGHMDLLEPETVASSVAAFLRGHELASGQVTREEPFLIERALMIYDGACAFCRDQVERMKRRTKDCVAYVPFQSGEFAIPRDALARAVHVIDTTGRVTRGAEAVFTALAAPTGSHPLLWSYRNVPGFAFVSERVYRWVARNRSRYIPPTH